MLQLKLIAMFSGLKTSPTIHTKFDGTVGIYAHRVQMKAYLIHLWPLAPIKMIYSRLQHTDYSIIVCINTADLDTQAAGGLIIGRYLINGIKFL